MVQDVSQAGRKLQQTTPAADVRVRAQAADAAGASTARSQLQEAVSNGNLAVYCPSQNHFTAIPTTAWEVHSVVSQILRGSLCN